MQRSLPEAPKVPNKFDKYYFGHHSKLWYLFIVPVLWDIGVWLVDGVYHLINRTPPVPANIVDRSSYNSNVQIKITKKLTSPSPHSEIKDRSVSQSSKPKTKSPQEILDNFFQTDPVNAQMQELYFNLAKKYHKEHKINAAYLLKCGLNNHSVAFELLTSDDFCKILSDEHIKELLDIKKRIEFFEYLNKQKGRPLNERAQKIFLEILKEHPDYQQIKTKEAPSLKESLINDRTKAISFFKEHKFNDEKLKIYGEVAYHYRKDQEIGRLFEAEYLYRSALKNRLSASSILSCRLCQLFNETGIRSIFMAHLRYFIDLIKGNKLELAPYAIMALHHKKQAKNDRDKKKSEADKYQPLINKLEEKEVSNFFVYLQVKSDIFLKDEKEAQKEIVELVKQKKQNKDDHLGDTLEILGLIEKIVMDPRYFSQYFRTFKTKKIFEAKQAVQSLKDDLAKQGIPLEAALNYFKKDGKEIDTQHLKKIKAKNQKIIHPDKEAPDDFMFKMFTQFYEIMLDRFSRHYFFKVMEKQIASDKVAARHTINYKAGLHVFEERQRAQKKRLEQQQQRVQKMEKAAEEERAENQRKKEAEAEAFKAKADPLYGIIKVAHH